MVPFGILFNEISIRIKPIRYTPPASLPKNRIHKKREVFRSKIHRLITDAPPYISNHILHTDLCIPKVTEKAKLYYSKFRYRLRNHTNLRVKKSLPISIPGNYPPPHTEDSSVTAL